MLKIRNLLFVLIAFTFACNEDENPIELPDYKKFLVSVDLVQNNEVINLADTIILDNNQKLKLSKANIYISNLTFLNGTQEEKVDSILFFNMNDGESVLVETTEDVEIEKIKFNVGVDPLWNLSDPSLVSADHPLGINNSGNHWNWDVGYIFYKLEGRVDANNDGIIEGADDTFLYHVGKNPFYSEVEINKNVPQVIGGIPIVQLNIDIDKLFENINFDENNTSHSSGDQFEFTEQLNNNLQAAFQ